MNDHGGLSRKGAKLLKQAKHFKKINERALKSRRGRITIKYFEYAKQPKHIM